MIKGRLKHTASFFALWFPVLASASVGLLWFGSVSYGSVLVCYACAVSDQ